MTAQLGAPLVGVLDSCLDSFDKLELVHVLRASSNPLFLEDLYSPGRDRGDFDETVAELARKGVLVVKHGDRIQLRLGPRAREEPFEQLMSVYAVDRVAVLSALSSILLDRVRDLAERTLGTNRRRTRH